MSLTLPPLLLGHSVSMERLRAEIQCAARSDAKVLVLGETGVGKEVVARLIHASGARSRQPFVAVNCSGIPETLLASELFGHTRGSFTGAYRDKIGLVQQADRGTLFLDELGEMSLAMQAMLLRFTETGEIQPVGAERPVGRTNVRMITATNRDLREQVAGGAFREDLYYRVNVIQIHVPPLRERGHDILMLFRHYLQQASEAYRLPCPTLAAEAEEALLAYRWPGNVRELRNMTERLVLRTQGQIVCVEDLPSEILQRSLSEGSAARPPVSPPPLPVDAVVDLLWERLLGGEDFWAVVQRPFKAREVTRTVLAALIDRGLRKTHGSYRALVKLFNLASSDYKRFHAFLYQQHCNLPVGPYRSQSAGNPPIRLPDTRWPPDEAGHGESRTFV